MQWLILGDRQADLKEERRRAQMAAARQVLERSTMMLLTSSKTCLRHPECPDSRENRDTVFCQMRRAMDLIHYVVKDGVLESVVDRLSPRGAGQVDWDSERASAFTSLKHFSRLIELSRPQVTETTPKVIGNSDIVEETPTTRELTRSSSVRDRRIEAGGRSKNRTYASLERELLPPASRSAEAAMLGLSSVLVPETRDQLLAALDKVVEKTQDFTDSAYTTHEHRENILLLCDRAKLELNQLLRIAVNTEPFATNTTDIDGAIESVQSAGQDLSQQLVLAVSDQVTELGHVIKAGIDVVNSLRNIALNQELDRLQECADRFHDYIDHILEVSNYINLSCITTLICQFFFRFANYFVILLYLRHFKYRPNLWRSI